MSHDHGDHNGLTCEEVIANLFAYLDDETDAEKRRFIERHLAECRACCSRAEFEKALRAKVRETGDRETPNRLRERIRTLLEQT